LTPKSLTKKQRALAILSRIQDLYPDATCSLDYATPVQLLVATILSAQCTDERVNKVTPGLFKRFPDAKALSESSVDEIFSYIRSVSYPNNKAKHLLGLGQRMVDSFEGQVPETMEDLQSLPGVGRKTANVIASVIYNQPTMAVDTHVFRVSRRLGLVPKTANTPLKVELSIIKHLPDDIIPVAHHWLILHGRYVCLARTPKCPVCEISHFCAHFEKIK
jgi:endonuclease-3